MKSEKLTAGSAFPEITVPDVTGGEVTLGSVSEGGQKWKLVVVYRGLHCPICKRYLTTLEGLKDEYAAANVEIVAVSGDGLEKAKTFVDEVGLSFPVGYDLTTDQMEELGLYISDPRSPQETDQPFPEPGLFAIRPDGRIHIIDISNAPFARPELGSILNGLKFIQEKDYPVRGTH
ncbi:MAG: AhpC/TSA family protein [Proteobacteria bacterium]|nr:AhpC/TSA family protein [Pseudomonadota bacterium]